jgi:nucleotide-binding universal stress UspA family protein
MRGDPAHPSACIARPTNETTRTMTKLESILVATDLSPRSMHAVDRAVELAARQHARLTLIHALGLDALGPLRDLLGTQATDVGRRIEERQRARLDAVAADATTRGVDSTDVHIEEGLSTSVVPAYADATPHDLLVVGARGEGTLRRMIVGSTASRLLRKSHRSVLIVKRPATAPYRRVLIAVDFSENSVQAAALARAVAPDAHLVLLHVFDVPFEGMLQYAGVSDEIIHQYRIEARTRAQHGLADLIARAGLAQADHTAIVEHGDAVHRITTHLERADFDLVVMGKHGTHVTEELLLGSVTKRVLSESEQDMLVVVGAARPQAEPQV